MSKRPPRDGELIGGPSKLARLEGSNGYGQEAKPEFGSRMAPVYAGLQLKARPPQVHYRDGKPMKELASLWRMNTEFVEVIIPPEAMSGTNKQVKSRQLWGNKVYTDDSDVVAVLMHLGFYSTNNGPTPPTVAAFHALLSLHPPRDQYSSCFRNAVRSRAWYARTDGCSYSVERAWVGCKSGSVVELMHGLEDGALASPTFAPSGSDRPVATRSATGSNRSKPLPEVTVMYNLVNEPWIKYTTNAVADRGLRSSQWTSARLREETLYMESHRDRFQLSYSGSGDGDEPKDTYTMGRCKVVLPLSLMRKAGVPLPQDQLEVLHTGVAWEEFEWGNLTLRVRGVEYPIVRIHFMQQTKGQT